MIQPLILFIDSGDTLIDEGTQVFDERGIVLRADCIPGAEELLRTLHSEGFQIALVADGEWESFQNVYRQHGLMDCFDAWVVSERVGEQKPAPVMFQTAMQQLGLTEADKKRIVMAGNNLSKDILGANRMGLTSVWMDWSPRYDRTILPDRRPDHIVHTPKELLALVHRLNDSRKEADA